MMSDSLANLVIRRATVADLARCAAIVNADIDARDFMPRRESVEAIQAMFTPELLLERVLLVAERSGVVVGYLSSLTSGDVRGFYVQADAQGAGVGRALMDGAKAEFPAGLRLTAFAPNDRARAFYRREGFAETGRVTVEEEGVPIVHLEWAPQ